MLAARVECLEQPVPGAVLRVDGAAAFDGDANRRSEQPVACQRTVEDDHAVSDRLERRDVPLAGGQIPEHPALLQVAVVAAARPPVQAEHDVRARCGGDLGGRSRGQTSREPLALPFELRVVDGDRAGEDLFRDRRQRCDPHASPCSRDPSLRLAERAGRWREDDVRACHRVGDISRRLLAVPRQSRKLELRHCSRAPLSRCRERLRDYTLLVVADDEHGLCRANTKAVDCCLGRCRQIGGPGHANPA